jgi:hypothetical protein
VTKACLALTGMSAPRRVAPESSTVRPLLRAQR